MEVCLRVSYKFMYSHLNNCVRRAYTETGGMSVRRLVNGVCSTRASRVRTPHVCSTSGTRRLTHVCSTSGTRRLAHVCSASGSFRLASDCRLSPTFQRGSGCKRVNNVGFAHGRLQRSRLCILVDSILFCSDLRRARGNH